MIIKKHRIRLILWAVAGGIFLLGVALYLALHPPFPLIPEIGRHLPSNFKEADAVFTDRVQRRFPLQTKETHMIHVLEEQGFSVNLKTKDAYFSKSHFPCLLEWHVKWASEQAVITKMDANYFRTCL